MVGERMCSSRNYFGVRSTSVVITSVNLTCLRIEKSNCHNFDFD